MKIYRNDYVPSYERYFFYLHSKCIEVENIGGNFHIRLANYNRKEVIKDSEHFPTVGEISESEIIKLILGKVK